MIHHLNSKPRRLRRVRSKIRGTTNQPRLSVFRSHRYIYAQIIDDDHRVTLASISGQVLNQKQKFAQKANQARAVGEEIAKLALKKQIKKVKFDRGACRYHGRVQALADAARTGGLEF